MTSALVRGARKAGVVLRQRYVRVTKACLISGTWHGSSRDGDPQNGTVDIPDSVSKVKRN
jgi:hypothetical protein